jgi:hypothetical protein
MSETKFKVGDRVRVVTKSGNDPLIGKLGTILESNDRDIYVLASIDGIEASNIWFARCNLELVEPAPVGKEPEAPQPRFKVGDRVRVRKPKDPESGWISPEMDIYDGGVYEIERKGGSAVRFKNHLEWAFLHEWLEPAPVVKECLTVDNVNHPPHYNQGGIECLEAIKAALGDGFVAHLRGNVIKYLWRCEHKGGVEDLKKAAWYLDRAIKEMEVKGE